MKRLLNEREAAELLHLSPRAMFNLRQRDEIPYQRIGGAIRYSEEALEAWVREQTAGTVPSGEVVGV